MSYKTEMGEHSILIRDVGSGQIGIGTLTLKVYQMARPGHGEQEGLMRGCACVRACVRTYGCRRRHVNHVHGCGKSRS